MHKWQWESTSSSAGLPCIQRIRQSRQAMLIDSHHIGSNLGLHSKSPRKTSTGPRWCVYMIFGFLHRYKNFLSDRPEFCLLTPASIMPLPTPCPTSYEFLVCWIESRTGEKKMTKILSSKEWTTISHQNKCHKGIPCRILWTPLHPEIQYLKTAAELETFQ